MWIPYGYGMDMDMDMEFAILSPQFNGGERLHTENCAGDEREWRIL